MKPTGYRILALSRLAALICCLTTVAPGFAKTTVTDLRCEGLDNPMGIDALRPRLSWVLISDERGQRQTAYQILVAGNPDKLEAGQGDLWDSGRVYTDQSIQVGYAGRVLPSNAQCFWKVRVWDKDGNVSDWSKPAMWTMGILQPADWHAKWIGLDGESVTNYLTNTSWIWFPAGEPAKTAPPGSNYFRRTFFLPDNDIKRAHFELTGDSEAKGFLNGHDIGGRNNPRVVRDQDVTCRLVPGTNVIALIGMNKGKAPKPAGVIARLTVEFENGETLIIPTDEQWKVSDKETNGWTGTGFDDSNWIAATNLGPVGMEPWGNVRTAESRRQPARWLRREFTAGKKIQRATVSFAGLGWSELYLNGAKVGDHVLSPAFAQYDKRVFYVTYDVTKQMQRGRNALGVVLGNGRYYADRSKIYSGTPDFGWPKLLLQLRLEYADGSVTNVVSDESWKLSTNGPIVANNDYDGEEYDARSAFRDWSRPGFYDQYWQPAQPVEPPAGVLAAEMIEPQRVTQTLKPVSLTAPKTGVYIFDMGQNMVGWCRLHVSGRAGTKVDLCFAENLKRDGTLDLANIRGALVTDTYTLNGSGDEVWEPRFTWHGFRYVELTGFPGEPTLDTIEGRVVNDDLATAGTFECSNPLLNRIYQAIIWGVRGNYHSIPTDCPQRDERQGWLGDRSEESLGETYLFDNSRLYAKWVQDMADAQRTNGSVPDVAPAYWPIYSDDVIWPSSGVIIPEMLRRQFADTQTLARHYDSARKWMTYMSSFVTDGLISKDAYGDWCVPPEDPGLIFSKDPKRQTDKTLLATAYFYHDLRLMEGFAQRLGKTEDARRFREQAEKMKVAFNNRFLNRKLARYDNGTQTSSVLPLAFGLVPDELRARVFQQLVDKIEKENRGHIGTGLVGGQYLMRVLSDNGRPDLACQLATQTDYPSWGHMLGQGATTIWELWNGNTADSAMNSGNHVMLVGDFVIWLYEDLAGIKPDPAAPGFKHILMKPLPVGTLRFVRATHRSPYGWIVSDWRREGGTFDWQIEVPMNTTATVYVPAKSLDRVLEGGMFAKNVPGLKFMRMENGRAVFEVGGGKYHFVSE
ncbi:MAG TPA: family 78 glycoside hydrolase catalytic domain [Candidatus Acidoferrum sp.]|nr:family 78 glycoside hydrolase catalytic domain [Candidatus Acidoferrum sp.]